MVSGLSKAIGRLTEFIAESRDNFGRDSTNTIQDILVVDGEKDFTPERLRYYKDGQRRFLEYGDDANYSEVNTGHLLSPDADQTLRLQSAERSFYPVGNDLLASMSRRITQPPQPGDAVAGGYGIPDLANFDPETVTYADGSNADGFLWYHTAETGLEKCILALVQDGTVVFDRQVKLKVAADVLTILEKQLNYYGVGPAVTRQTFTDTEEYPDDPQLNPIIGAVANDDGKGPARGSQHVNLSVHQAAGNTGLEVELGSLAVRTSGPADPEWKTKGHAMDLEYTNPTATYQVCAAIRSDPLRPGVKLRIPEFNITRTPGTGTSRTRVLIVAVSPVETNAPAVGEWDTPIEHNPKNSVLQEVEVDASETETPLTGPDQDGATTNVDGPDTTNAMDNPGGYQIGRDSVTPEGTGNSPPVESDQTGDRELYDMDIGLLLVDAASAGTVEIDMTTEQNS